MYIFFIILFIFLIKIIYLIYFDKNIFNIRKFKIKTLFIYQRISEQYQNIYSLSLIHI